MILTYSLKAPVYSLKIQQSDPVSSQSSSKEQSVTSLSPFLLANELYQFDGAELENDFGLVFTAALMLHSPRLHQTTISHIELLNSSICQL